MTALERAQTYVRIFINATRRGKDWRDYRPLDGTLRGDVLELQGVWMEPIPDGWRLSEGNRSWIIRPAEEVKAS